MFARLSIQKRAFFGENDCKFRIAIKSVKHERLLPKHAPSVLLGLCIEMHMTYVSFLQIRERVVQQKYSNRPYSQPLKLYNCTLAFSPTRHSITNGLINGKQKLVHGYNIILYYLIDSPWSSGPSLQSIAKATCKNAHFAHNRGKTAKVKRCIESVG